MDLQAAVAAKTFREDLYFPIAAVPVSIIPSLRDRSEDVLLAERFKREFRRPGLAFAADAPGRLLSYRWPGKVRELH